MDREYEKNQKKQKKSFKKFRKNIIKALIWGGIGLASALFFPAGVFPALKGLLGESVAINATFFTQWGIALLGAVGAGVNIYKARKERKSMEDSQDYEEEIIDAMKDENSQLKDKVKDYENQLSEQRENNKQNNNSKTDNYSQEYQETNGINKELKR